MHPTHVSEQQENVPFVNVHSDGFYCLLPKSELEAFQRIKHPVAYSCGATIFLEGQPCQGIYILCSGRVKLYATSRDGQTLIFKIAKAGDVLGLSATVSATLNDASAEAGHNCELNFVRASDFLQFLKENVEARMHAALHLSTECQQAYRQFRSLMGSAPERIAQLILDWSVEDSGTVPELGITLSLTHEEIAQIIGTSRETVTRTLADFRKRRIAELHGSTLVVQNLAALQQIAAPELL
jgi:CRP/FNR family transcriptional regulator, cyclic AMP receptor protein